MPSGENELEGVSVTSGNMNVAGLCLIFTIRTLCKVFALPVGGGFARFRFRYGGEEKSLALGHKRRAETWFTLCWLGWEIKVVRWQWICESCESCTVQNCTFFWGGGFHFCGKVGLVFQRISKRLAQLQIFSPCLARSPRSNFLESLRTADEMFGAEGRPIHALEKVRSTASTRQPCELSVILIDRWWWRLFESFQARMLVDFVRKISRCNQGVLCFLALFA